MAERVQLLRERINFEKSFLYLFVAFAFTMPLSRATNSIFPSLIIVLFIFKNEYSSLKKLVVESALIQAILAFIAFATLSILWSSQILNALDFMRFYFQWLAIFVIALNVKKEHIRPIISAFILGMVLSEILSYAMFFDLIKMHGHGSDSPSPFMFHIDYSVFLAFTSLLLLNRLLSTRHTKKEKLFMALFFMSIVINLFINRGRTGQVALFVSLFVVVFMHFRFSLQSIFIVILLSVSLFGGAYTFSHKFKVGVQMVQNNIEKLEHMNFNSSWGKRVAQYYVAYDIVKENPLIGVGVGDWKIASYNALQKDNHGFSKPVVKALPMRHFHNQYLNIVVQTGLIGLLLLFYVLYRYRLLSIKDAEIKELSILFLSVYIVSFMAEPLWMKQFTNVLFILFTGLFIGASLNKKDETSITN